MADVERLLTELGPRLDVPGGGAGLAATVAERIEPAGGGTGARRAPQGSCANGGLSANGSMRTVGAQTSWPSRGKRRLDPVVVAVAAVVMAALLVALPQPRQAVARWFGIGGVRFELTGEDGLPPDLGTELDLGAPVAADDAAAEVPFEIRVPEAVGPPAAAFTGRPRDGITMVWPASDELPEVGRSGLGLLLTEFPGSTSDTLVAKELDTGTRLEPVSVDGHDGYWITGAPHVVTYLDPDGNARFDAVRLAGNTLLWEADGVTHRMEAALDLGPMLELAESVRRVR
jgi:hypothetical protein